MRIAWIVATIAVLAVGAARAESAHPQRSEIASALEQMLGQTVDPFLIVEDARSEKFIQFYNDDGRVLIDLPKAALDEEESARAAEYFRRTGIPLTRSRDVDPKTGATVVSETWTTTYSGRQVDQVVDVALGALFTIYRMNAATPLTLTRGWQ